MIKHVKTKKQNLRLKKFANLMLVFAFFMYVFSAIFLRTYNVQLSVNIQNITRQIASIEQENAVISTSIQELSSKDRVMSIALEDGISSNQSNIVIVNYGD